MDDRESKWKSNGRGKEALRKPKRSSKESVEYRERPHPERKRKQKKKQARYAAHLIYTQR